MAIAKVPRKKVQPWQAAGFGSQAAYRQSDQYKPAGAVKAAPRGQVTFQPTAVNLGRYGTPAGGNQDYWQTQPGYRQYSRQGQKYPNAPKMPVEFNPNADTNTLQGAVDAGLLPWSQSLGGLGINPPPRAPGNINIPGYSPPGMDISGDWEYQAALGDLEAADRADAAAAGENINALAVNWGGDLSEMVKSGLIDQKAADAAKANQFSQMADLGRALSKGTGQAQAQLASRGILSSGALPGIEGELNRQYQQETTTGLQDVMGKIRSVRASQAQGSAERRAGLAGVRSSVANRLIQDPMYQPIPDQQAFWDNSSQTYVDDWGRRFNRQGQRLS